MTGDDQTSDRERTELYVKRPGGEVLGPFEIDEIRMMLEARRVGPDASVSRDRSEWRPIRDVPALSEVASERSSGPSADGSPPSGTVRSRDDSDDKTAVAEEPRLAGGADDDGAPGLPRPADSTGDESDESGGEPTLPASADSASGEPERRGGAELPASAKETAEESEPLELPTRKGGGRESGEGVDLPTSTDGSDSPGSELPETPSSAPPEADGPPDLPKSVREEEESGRTEPELPDPIDSEDRNDGNDPIALGNESNLPALGGEDSRDDADLPRPSESPADAEAERDESLPRSSDDNLPTPEQSEKGSAPPGENLPTRSAPDEAEAPLPEESRDAPESDEDDALDGLFEDEPEEDLFDEEGSPESPADEDLFGEEEPAGDDLFEDDREAPDDDLFGPDGGETAGDDLFAEGDSADDDLFSDDAELGDDLFADDGAADEGPAVDESFEEDSPEDDGELFGEREAGGEELLGEELLDEEAPGSEKSPGPESIELAEEPGDPELESDDEKLQLGADPVPEGAPGSRKSGPGTSSPSGDAAPSDAEQGDDALELDRGAARDAGVRPEGSPGAQPASTGAPDGEEQPESASSADEAGETPASAEPGSSGSSTIRIAGLVTLLAVVAAAGGGYYLFVHRTSSPTPSNDSEQQTSDERIISLDLERPAQGTYPALSDFLDRTDGADLSESQRGRFLLVASHFLARYDSKSVEKRASRVAGALEGADQGFPALGRGAWAARSGEVEVARPYLEPLFESNKPIVSYFSHLSAGMAYTLAAERHSSGNGPGASSGESLPSTTGGETEAPDALVGDSDAGGARGADTGPTAGSSSDVSAEGPPETDADEETGPRKTDVADRGASQLERAAAAADGRADPHYWLGRLREATGAEQRALEAYESAFERQNDHVASRLRAARLRYESGDLQEAFAVARTVLEKFRDSAAQAETAEAYHLVGMVESARSRDRKAIEAFREALDRDPNRPESIRRLTTAYENAGDWKSALDWFESNRSLGKKHPALLLGLVRAHMGLEQWQSAINVLETGERRFPENARFSYLLGELHRERGAFSEAREAMQRAVRKDPDLLDALGSLAQLTWRLDENLERAEYYIEQITRHADQLDAPVATKVGGFYRMSKRRTLAEKWYRVALERNPNYLPARLQLAQLYLERQKGARARTLLEDAREAGVEDPRISAYLADAYRQTGEYDRAIKAIDEVLERHPDHHEFVFIRGLVHFDRGNYANARRDFVKTRELRPLFDRAHFYQGRVAFERGRYEKALKIMRQVLDDHPENGEYRFWVGRILEERGRLEAALEEYRQVTKYDEAYGVENPNLYVHRGGVLVELGFTERGKQEIRKALEIDPDLDSARLRLAEAHHATKDYEAAIEQFERALDDRSDAPEARYKLGMSLVYTDQKREGTAQLQKAVEAGYDDPSVYETLGYLYKELGERRLAVDAFESYLKQTDNDRMPASTRREVLRQIEELGG